jgi:alpha-amylase
MGWQRRARIVALGEDVMAGSAVGRSLAWTFLLIQACGGAGEPRDERAGAALNAEADCQQAPPIAPELRRTVILVEARLAPWEHLFVRGGVRSGPARGPRRLEGIPIRHRNVLDPFTRAWKEGDTLLDMSAHEPEQRGVIGGLRAQGTPADWTTDRWAPAWGPERTVERDGYGVEPLNTYGPSYFMVDVDMDCARVPAGPDGTRAFEFTTFVWPGRGGERRVHQPDAPYASPYHFGRCGAITVVRRDRDQATYASFPPPPVALELPPGFAWCPPGSACAGEEGLATSCPQEGVACSSDGRSTVLAWTLEGMAFEPLLVPVYSSDPALQFFLAPGASNTSTNFDLLWVRGASRARIVEGEGTALGSFTYYDVPPVWGGTTVLDFRGATLRADHGSATFVWHASYDLGYTDEQLVAMVDEVYSREVALAGREVPGGYHVFFLPSELAGATGGDGNYAFAPDTAMVNYGNPDWMAYLGGLRVSALSEWAHELSHLLFIPVWSQFDDPTCLSEGVADATGNFLGYVPDTDGNWVSNTLASSCRGRSIPHDLGNCYLWHLKHFGASDASAGRYWTSATLGAIYDPQRRFDFSTCVMPAPTQAEPTAEDVRTGDLWVVFWSGATGEDMTAFVQSLGFFTSGSLPASRAALVR